jgi:hypothetical protein
VALPSPNEGNRGCPQLPSQLLRGKKDFKTIRNVRIARQTWTHWLKSWNESPSSICFEIMKKESKKNHEPAA